MKRVFLIALLLAFACSAGAQSGGVKGLPVQQGDGKAARAHKGAGVVRSVDAKKGTVSLAHDRIQSLNWPAMTMTFKVKDKALLEQVKPGAKVEFTFVQSGKDYIVTEIK